MESYRLLAKKLLAGESAGRTLPISETEVLTEVFQSIPVLVILGGGHISRTLCAMAQMTGYRVVVVDDREEFAQPARFPLAEHVYCLPFAEAFQKKLFPPDASYVIVTRGHENDYLCLKQVLRTSYAYVGMIGSRRKTAVTMERMLADGFLPEICKEVHAPIGLAIGAETPEEIAVSILAELIAEKAKQNKTAIVPEVLHALACDGQEMVMLTVLEKTGSAPRGKGSRMLLLQDGSTVGTIGGGAVEYAAVKRGRELFKEKGIFTEVYDLSGKEAAGLGMICGGCIRVLFEWIERI